MAVSLRLLLCCAVLAATASSWSFDEWAANELLPRTRDLVRRHMVGARMYLATEPKAETEQPSEGEKKEENGMSNSIESASSSSSSSSSEEKKTTPKTEESSVAVTTQQPTTTAAAATTASSTPEAVAAAASSTTPAAPSPSSSSSSSAPSTTSPSTTAEPSTSAPTTTPEAPSTTTVAATSTTPAATAAPTTVSSTTASTTTVAATTEAPTTTTTAAATTPAATAAPSTTTIEAIIVPLSSVEKKTSEEELAGKIVDVAEVLRQIVDKKDSKKAKTMAEVKLEKKLEKLPLVKEIKSDGGVMVQKVRKVTPSASTAAPVPATTPAVAQYRRVSCDMCLKAFNGLNYNVVQMKKVAEDMVSKDCEALLYGDEEAIGACVEVMLRKIDEYYNKFEHMIQTNKACVRLGMCAPHLVSNRIPL